MPISTSALTRLADCIRGVCRKGFYIDGNTWRYLENTLPDPTPQSVAETLNDEKDCESDSLIELVFYPDERMQITLEPEIESVSMTPHDQFELMDMLTAGGMETTLHFPSHEKKIDLSMPELALRQFVIRLNLCYRLPLKLAQVLPNHLPDTVGVKLKVRLRNYNRAFSDHQTDLLTEVFKQLDNTLPDYWECIDFVLNALPEVTPYTEFYDFFMKKKKFYFQCVQKAENFMERLQRSNVETLMMQGDRAAFLDPDQGRRTMAWIDQICRALFGRSDYLHSPIKQELEINPSDSRKALSKIITRLS